MKKQGVLLVNLGSPDSPTVPDVKKYLREFLMDGRVLDVAWPVRFCIVNFAILPKRPKESAHAYRSIWTDAGSPLVATSKNVRTLLEKRLSVPVELAMRYQNPSIEDAINNFNYAGIDEVLLVPLFPHYAMSSYETAVVRVREVAAELAPQMRIVVKAPYYNDPDYIDALVGSASELLKRDFDHLLFSFHGIPERQLHKPFGSDCGCLNVKNWWDIPSPAPVTCYRSQCFNTTKEFVKKAGLPKAKCSVAFQSRLGRDPWLTPYTDYELERLARNGVKKLLVICPAFVSDCLETIEEIGMRGKETFLAAGGETYTMIPCLNEHPLWIRALEKFVQKEFPNAVAARGQNEAKTHEQEVRVA